MATSPTPLPKAIAHNHHWRTSRFILFRQHAQHGEKIRCGYNTGYSFRPVSSCDVEIAFTISSYMLKCLRLAAKVEKIRWSNGNVFSMTQALIKHGQPIRIRKRQRLQ